MAEKLSINIDLSNSRRIDHQTTDKTTDKTIKSVKQQKKMEYKYRYDRILVVVICIVFAVIGFSVFLFDDEGELVKKVPLAKLEIKAELEQSTEKKTKQVVMEKHLSTSSDEPEINYQQPVYLYYETINVFGTFHSPIKPVPPSSSIPDKEVLKQADSNAEQKKSEPPIHLDAIDSSEQEEVADKTNKVDSKPLTVAHKVAGISKQDTGTIDSSEQKKAGEQTNKMDLKPVTVAHESAEIPNQNIDFIYIYSPKLSRVKLVSNIYKKEPVNELSYRVTGHADTAKKVYLFTQFDNSIGKTIEHQWWYQGKMIIKKKFTALGKRWRCYSSKNIGKLQQGEWQIKVVDDENNILSIVNFNYQIN